MHQQLLELLLRRYNPNEPLTQLQIRNLIKDLRSLGMTDAEVDATIDKHWST
jgi:hypothetical protein